MCLLGTMLFLGLVGCKQANDDVATSDYPTEQGAPTKQIRVELSAGMTNDELRMLYDVKNDGTGGLVGLNMEETNVILRIITKQGDNGRAIAQDIEFTKAPGENRAVFSGNITVPASASAEPYKIAAILVERVGASRPYPKDLYNRINTPTEISSGSYIRFWGTNAFHLASGNKLSVDNLPYLSKWQTISVDASNNLAHPVNLQLDPMGTLLRVRIKNATGSPVTFHNLKMVSDAFVSIVDVLQPLNDNGSVDWRTGNSIDHDFTLPNGSLTIAPDGQSDWMYTWLMPRTTNQKVSTSLRLALNNSAPLVYTPDLFFTNEPLPLGSVPLVITYRGNHNATFGNFADVDTSWGASTTTQPKLSIEYLAPYALNKDGNGFVNNYLTNNEQVGWFTHEQMMSRFSSPVVIGGKRYSVPTPNEMASILPRLVGPGSNGLSRFMVVNGPSFNVIEENVKIGDVTQNYTSDYIPTAGALYAVRFKNSSNRNKTAFRYRTILNGTSRSLIVECVYLGTTRFEGIEDVATESFWTTNASQIVKREIPFYGGRTYPNGMEAPGVFSDINGSVLLGLAAPKFDKTTIQYGSAAMSRNGLSPYGMLLLSSIYRDFPLIPFER